MINNYQALQHIVRQFKELALKGTCIQDDRDFVHGCQIANYFIVLRSQIETPSQHDCMSLVVLPKNGGAPLFQFEKKAVGVPFRACCTRGTWYRDILGEAKGQGPAEPIKIYCATRQAMLSALCKRPFAG